MKYRAKNLDVRKLLDRPRWQEWLEYELTHMRRLCPEFQMTYDNFSPDALEWSYYHDACLKPGSHEVVELLHRMAEAIPVKYHRYLHQGLTSSNVIDGCNHIRWKELLHLYVAAYSDIPTVKEDLNLNGYTHGMRATVTSLRHRQESALIGLPLIKKHLPGILDGGPVGFETTDNMNLHRQAFPRHAYFQLWSNLLVGSASLSQLALDYRFYASDLRIGMKLVYNGTTSSAMPGKNNPSEWERINSLDLLIRGCVMTLMSTPPQWLDRDLVHSAMERETIDRLWEYAFYQLEEMTRLLSTSKLVVTDEVKNEPTSGRMNLLLEEGHDWHTARLLSKDEKYWADRRVPEAEPS